jgi:hypothetical protein
MEANLLLLRLKKGLFFFALTYRLHTYYFTPDYLLDSIIAHVKRLEEREGEREGKRGWEREGGDRRKPQKEINPSQKYLNQLLSKNNLARF